MFLAVTRAVVGKEHIVVDAVVAVIEGEWFRVLDIVETDGIGAQGAGRDVGAFAARGRRAERSDV